MADEDGRFRKELFGYRKSDVLCWARELRASCAAQRRLAREEYAVLERRVAMVEEENGALRRELARRSAAETIAAVNTADAEQTGSEIELLSRKLAAAQAEIRRYQTKLFAYERAMTSLRRENDELEEFCEQARQQGVEFKPKRELPHFEAVEEEPRSAVAERVETPRFVQSPARESRAPVPRQKPGQPRTQLEQISCQLLDEMDRLLRQETPADAEA